MAGGTTKTKKSPADQAKAASPINGQVPPVEHRFAPGQSGNPAGRPTAGASVREHLNRMAEMSIEDIQAEFASSKTSAAAKIAARTWLDAMSPDRNSSGSPIAGGEFDRICDRTLGKPVQAMDMTSDGKSLAFTFVVAKPADANG